MIKKRHIFKKGDTVRTRYKFGGRNRRGVVESVNGAYIYVRLNGKNGYVIEAYPNELDVC